MAKKSVAIHLAAGLNEQLATLPADADIYVAENPMEVEFLSQWRAADDVGQTRLVKMLIAAARGELPSPEIVKAMTRKQTEAFLDALPAVGA